MKNDAIGNRTRDLLTCSAVPQPTPPPRAPQVICSCYLFRNLCYEKKNPIKIVVADVLLQYGFVTRSVKQCVKVKHILC